MPDLTKKVPDMLIINVAIDNIVEGAEDFNEAVSGINEIVEKINNGNGTAAKFVNDSELYDMLLKILDNTNKLVIDIKDNPKNYIKWTDIIKAWRSKE